MKVPAHVKRVKSRRRRTHRLRSFLLILLLLPVCYAGYRAWTDVTAGGRSSDAVVVISEGADGAQIAEQLREAKAIDFPLLYRLYHKMHGQDDYQMGEHTIPRGAGYQEIYEILSEITAPTGVSLLIPEGYELRQIAAEAERVGLVSAADFLAAAQQDDYSYDFLPPVGTENRLEGYLFPATYTFAEGTTAREMIDAMLQKCDQVYSEQYRRRAEELSLTTAEVFTLASIVEREAAGGEDRDLVSSVFWNRIKSNMRLESCATIQYILQERKEVLSEADTRIQSPYNTYRNNGLPPTPIASPGEESIRAALYPADSQYYFFVVGSDGKHVFSRTYEEHLRAGARTTP